MTRGTKRAAAGAFAGVLMIGAGCEPNPAASAGGGCHYQGWQGQCVLTDLRTTRLIERPPQTYVVVQATYEPRGAPGEFVPPPFHKEAFAAAPYERMLTDHLATYRTVQCAVLEPGADACAPKMAANVPEFLPPANMATSGPLGCAKIEHTDSASLSSAPISLPGPFQFDVGVADLTPDDQQLGNQAAAKILSDPRIECVAVKGKTAAGENFALANERSQAVKKLLESRGVDHSRLTVFEATAPTYTAAPTDDQPVASEQRRVYLTVILYKNQ